MFWKWILWQFNLDNSTVYDAYVSGMNAYSYSLVKIAMKNKRTSTGDYPRFLSGWPNPEE